MHLLLWLTSSAKMSPDGTGSMELLTRFFFILFSKISFLGHCRRVSLFCLPKKSPYRQTFRRWRQCNITYLISIQWRRNYDNDDVPPPPLASNVAHVIRGSSSRPITYTGCSECNKRTFYTEIIIFQLYIIVY